MRLVDIHTHFPERSIADICIASPLADGMFSLEEQIRQASFSLQNDILFSFGIHPWQVAISGDDIEDKLVQLDDFFSKGKENVLMGEIGLDSCRADLQRQIIIFKRQLDIATKHECPAVVIHCVKALHLVLPILEDFRKTNKKTIVVIHGFCGNVQEAVRLSRSDVYFSFSSKLLSCSKKTQQAAASVAKERILTETDMDDPASLSVAIEQISQIRGMKTQDCAQMIFENAQRVIASIKLCQIK